MSNEDLLKPRYKVIADYPGNNNNVGDIITIETAKTKEAEQLVCGWYDKYKANFKRLEWWEDRKIEEMPEFVKAGIELFKIIEWKSCSGDAIYFDEVGQNQCCIMFYMKGTLPATATEYEQYIKQKGKTMNVNLNNTDNNDYVRGYKDGKIAGATAENERLKLVIEAAEKVAKIFAHDGEHGTCAICQLARLLNNNNSDKSNNDE